MNNITESFFTLNSKGHLKKRESYNLEFKQSFNQGDHLLEYARTIVGMANHKGGIILFGIRDSPHDLIGLQNDKFTKCDPAKIHQIFQENFDPEIHWEMETIEYDEKIFGIISVKEADNKPIVCKKSKGKLREGAVYYRYRGETKEIRFPELKRLLDEEKEKEKKQWMQIVEKIASAGPNNIQLLDTYKGEIDVGGGKVLLDKNVIDQLKFIKEGQFSETEGAPTLRLVGDITGIVDPQLSIAPDILYPYTSSDIWKKLGINSYQWTCIVWKLNIKNNSKYHVYIKSGNKSGHHKYSEALIPLIKRMLKRPDFLDQCKKEYQTAKPVKRKKS